MKPPFRLQLINGSISHDTVQCLRALLKKAEAGEVLGLGYGAILKNRRFIVHTCGEAHRNPTFTLGVVEMLSDELRERVKEGAE